MSSDVLLEQTSPGLVVVGLRSEVTLVVHPVVEHTDETRMRDWSTSKNTLVAICSPGLRSLRLRLTTATSPFMVSRRAAIYSAVRSEPHVLSE